MPEFSQAKRPMRVETPLGTDKLLLAGISGRESVSTPFHYRLDLMSEDAAIAGADLLRKPVTIAILLPDGTERFINGVVRRFAQLGSREGLTFYEAEIVPWFWMLSLTRDCWIFQEKSVLDIVEDVFAELGFSDYEVRCTASYDPREYCVQYRETHLDFVSRLLEDEGIFYYFEHKDGKHTLILADTVSSISDIAGPATLRLAVQPEENEDIVRQIRSEDSVFIGTVELTDYDPLQPSNDLATLVSGQGEGTIYDYPGKYTKLSDGDRYARLRLEAEEALRRTVRGDGSCRGFQAGAAFTLEHHFRSEVNRRYMLLEVTMQAAAGDYRTWDTADFDYRCNFIAIPDDTPYRPARQTKRPIVQGTQTALVVGKAGEEIWVDKYGRVKVQFYWDPDGKNDENSSCWVRVSSAWAGKNWGAVHIPRMGQEVIVDFLEGDPDRPIITGRVYNAEQMPPYDLPKNQTQSGIKSRSSKSGGTEDFNEIRMEDLKGKELLYVHAQKDKQVMVENDRTEEVGNDETIDIGNDRTEHVKANEKITIDANRTEKVGGDEKITIDGNRTEKVGSNEKITIGSNRTEKVGSNEKIKVGAARKLQVGSSETIKVAASRKDKIGASYKVDVGTSLTIKAGLSITLKVGGNSIKIDNSGIKIKGLMVKVEGQAKADLKSPMTNVEGTGMLTSKGAMHQVKGDGILMMSAPLTMIN